VGGQKKKAFFRRKEGGGRAPSCDNRQRLKEGGARGGGSQNSRRLYQSLGEDLRTCISIAKQPTKAKSRRGSEITKGEIEGLVSETRCVL